ncbi:MAG: hypothetical protein JWP18_1198, partial [Solirubrobacterales bacterium]|nr:hypothetical protein [Solirubrobacterales bacterium]
MVALGFGNRNPAQPRDREALLAHRAARQWGVVRWQDLLEDGFDGAAINRRVASGRLVRRHRGVYVVGHVPLAPEGVDLAAVYAAGGDAVLSERSGAVRMGMLRFAGAEVDVTTATRGRRAAIDGVTLHRTRGLPDSDRTLHLAIPIATVPRILLDLAARADISDRALESAAAQAERDGRLPRSSQVVLARRSRGRPGGERLRRALHAGPELLLSEEEHTARGLMITAGLPAPEANIHLPSDIGPLMCDLWWAAYGFVLEVHGGQHGRFLNATRDVVRDGAHRRAGRRVDAVTARAVRERPADV